MAYSGDPSWITVKYMGKCARCSSPLVKGMRAFYYPTTQTLLCDGSDCGRKASAEFAASCADEEA